MPQSLPWVGCVIKLNQQLATDVEKEDESGVAEAASGPSTPELNSSWGGPGRVGLFWTLCKAQRAEEEGKEEGKKPEAPGTT